MSNLYLKNTTTSSITVAGYTIHNINNEDAEIVEVEGTVGQELPSVGDIVTFGNYPQATSTPEPIEWIVLDVDSENEKALLIAKKVLDCHKYNSTNTSVTWETCSLRTWLNSTFFNAAFDSTEQGRIPLSHIENPNNPTYGTVGGSATDDYIFCLSIQEASNTAYFSDNNARKALATQHAIDAGASVSSGYAYWWLRSPGDSPFVAAIVSTGGSVYNNGDGVHYTSIGVRPAMWVSFNVTSVRFNAFKYTENNTSYWYVIDGVHESWTNDLASIGYSEIPGVVLPNVDIVTGQYNYGDYNTTLNAGYSINTNVTYDNNKLYSASTEKIDHTGVYYGFEIKGDSNLAYIKNVSNNNLSLKWWHLYSIDSTNATIVIVQDSNNSRFNAFKYTTNNVDYYYVIDGVHTNWVKKLSSIGYSDPIYTAYFNSDKSPKTIQILSGYYLYDKGTEIIADTSKIYTPITLYNYDNTVSSVDMSKTSMYRVDDNNPQLRFAINSTSGSSSYYVLKLEYLITNI